MAVIASGGVDDTLGALQIGAILAVYLFGIITLQAYTYFRHFPEDKIVFKALVGTVWTLELAHSALVSYEVYRVTIKLYGRPDLVERFIGLGVITVIGGFITMFCQIFFSARLWKVLPRPYAYIGIVCIVLTSIRCVGSSLLGAEAILAPNVKEFRTKWHWLITTLLTVGAAIDVTIAGAMLYFLARKRGHSLNKYVISPSLLQTLCPAPRADVEAKHPHARYLESSPGSIAVSAELVPLPQITSA
ncbi:hypothetical protein MD484_g8321, partial [Candolleomyces efflorescens]